MRDDNEIFSDTLKKIKESGMLGPTYGITFTSTFIDETINILQRPYVLTKEITPQHIKQLFYAFLDKQDDLFKEVFLDIKNNNRIEYVDNIEELNAIGTMLDTSGYYEKGNAILTIAHQENPVLELLTFIHELAHAVDKERDKIILTEEEFDKTWYDFKEVKNKSNNSSDIETEWVYRCNTNTEVPAELAELEALYIWIDEKRIDRKLAKYLLRETSLYRMGEVSLSLLTTVKFKDSFNDKVFLTGLLDNNDIPDKLLRFYAHSLSLYFANIEDKEKQKELLDIFNKKKPNLEGKEMFDAIDYDYNALKNTVKEYKLRKRKL